DNEDHQYRERGNHIRQDTCCGRPAVPVGGREHGHGNVPPHPTGSTDRDRQLVQAGAVRADGGLAVAGAVQDADRPVARCGVEPERTLLRCLDLTGELAVAVEQPDVRAADGAVVTVDGPRGDTLAFGLGGGVRVRLLGRSTTVTHDSIPPYRMTHLTRPVLSSSTCPSHGSCDEATTREPLLTVVIRTARTRTVSCFRFRPARRPASRTRSTSRRNSSRRRR